MATTFFGFGIAPSMFPVDCVITRKGLTPEAAKALVEQGVVPCLNPSHKATIDAMKGKFDIEVPIPDKAPAVALNPGDSVIVMGVRGLPRLEGRHEYTDEEVARATFDFSVFTVTE
jgi:hypothetical protein